MYFYMTNNLLLIDLFPRRPRGPSIASDQCLPDGRGPTGDVHAVVPGGLARCGVGRVEARGDAPRGRMSHSFAALSASLARGSPICQPCSSRPRLPRGSSRLWPGPATKPSSDIDMWQVVSGIASLLSDCGLQAVVQTVAGDGKPYLLHPG
jgi:hypothetical protein